MARSVCSGQDAAVSVDPFASARLGPITLRNRFIKAATFEGMARDGLATDRLAEYHLAVARGGVGMTTVAYMAVSPEGQGAPAEIVLRDAAIPSLRKLTDALHAEGAAVSAQVGHAGPVAAGVGRTALAPSRVFSPMAMKFTRAVTEDDIAKVIGDFANAGRVVAESGFDAIELHMGHGYLISAFMSPRLNRRSDRWGGSVANRARLARAITIRVREAIPDHVAVLAKLNMTDGVRRGLNVEDSLEIAQLLDGDGALDAIELTGGSSFQNPMYLFRGDAPIHEMAASFPQPIRTGFRLFGRKFLRSYPFEEAYFLNEARRFRSVLKTPVILLGGINNLATVESALDEGFAFVAMGRALLREPDLVRRFQAGQSAAALCIHCNKCMPTIYRGTHCVLVAPHDRPGHTPSA